MAPRATRGKPSKQTKSTPPPSPSKIAPKKLLKCENEQHRVFILPTSLSDQARIISLPHPVNGTNSRYLFCPKKGLFEFTRTSAATTAPSSWLLAPDARNQQLNDHGERSDSSLVDGYVLEDANLFVATPMDTLFLLMPLFTALLEASNAMFKMEDDHMETLSRRSKTMGRMLRDSQFRGLILQRLDEVSQTQDLGGDKVYKLDISALAKVVIGRIDRMVDPENWPPSMQESLVRKKLEIPIFSVPQTNDQLPTPEESQDSTLNESENGSSTEKGLLDSSNAPPTVTILMRKRVALDYILSAYVPPALRKHINEAIASESLVDYKELDDHLEKVQKSKAEILALRSLSDNISRKRGFMEDDEAVEARAEKKRKKEEEDLRKKNESRAIKQLKKVDVSGMQKMSSFFKKVPPKSTTA